MRTLKQAQHNLKHRAGRIGTRLKNCARKTLQASPIPSTVIGPVKGGISVHDTNTCTISCQSRPGRFEPDISLANLHRQYSYHKEVEHLEEFVAEVDNARLLGYGDVISSCDRLLKEVSWVIDDDYSKHPAFRKMRYGKAETVDSTVSPIASVSCQNYYHWLYESLPRFAILEKSGMKTDKYLVCADSEMHRRTLELLGIEKNKQIKASEETHISCRKLVTPSIPGPCGYPPRWVPNWLHQKFTTAVKCNNQQESPRRIYIARKRVSRRRILNEPDVSRLLESFGFVAIEAGELSFDEQVRLFNNADIIVGPHGAAFSNLAFAPEGTAVIEIFSKSYVNLLYGYIAHHRNHSYHPLIDENPTTEDLHRRVNANMTVDTVVLESTLKRIITNQKNSDRARA